MSISLRILISGDLAFFATVVDKKIRLENDVISILLSSAEWEDCDHEKGDMWSIQSIKTNLEKQRIKLDMIPSEKKECVLLMLFNSIPIENCIFSLLHPKIDICNKIFDSFFSWIIKYIEPLSNDEIEMSNNLIDLQVEQIQNKKLLEQTNQQNVTKIADFITKK